MEFDKILEFVKTGKTGIPYFVMIQFAEFDETGRYIYVFDYEHHDSTIQDFGMSVEIFKYRLKQLEKTDFLEKIDKNTYVLHYQVVKWLLEK